MTPQQHDEPIVRYRRKRSSCVGGYNPWDQAWEPGDFMVTNTGVLLRLEKPGSFGPRCVGELYPRTIKPPRSNLFAKIIKGEIWWCQRKERQ